VIFHGYVSHNQMLNFRDYAQNFLGPFQSGSNHPHLHLVIAGSGHINACRPFGAPLMGTQYKYIHVYYMCIYIYIFVYIYIYIFVYIYICIYICIYIYKSKLCTPTGMMNYVVFFWGSRIEQTSRCCSPKITCHSHVWDSTRRYLPSYACWQPPKITPHELVQYKFTISQKPKRLLEL